MAGLFIPQLLIISGTGRNSGKTTLACHIIKHLKETVAITAFKISPHNHSGPADQIPGFRIEEEFSRKSGKDSSRMLDAGANRSFYVNAADSQLEKLVSWIQRQPSGMIIAESGGLRHYVQPGFFIVVNHADSDTPKERYRDIMHYPHQKIAFDGTHFDIDINRIVVENNSWKFVE